MEFEKLQKIFSEVLQIEPDQIKKDMYLVNDLGADSLEIFQIIMAIEDEFQIVMEDEEIASIETVQDVLDRIAGKE